MLHLCSMLRPFIGLFLISFLLEVPQQDQQKQSSPVPAEDTPASIGLVLDNSGSMNSKRDSAAATLCELAKASSPQNEFFVVNFNDNAYMDLNFTSNSKSVCEALGRMDVFGGTALNDAVLASADHLVKGSKYKKRAIILVTHGIDNKSHRSVKEMLKELHEPGMPAVYCIGLLDPHKVSKARSVLDLLAQETGGMALYPENEEQLNEVAQQIAQEIRKR